MFLPSPVLVWVEALLPVALVGVQARGFFHATVKRLEVLWRMKLL